MRAWRTARSARRAIPEARRTAAARRAVVHRLPAGAGQQERTGVRLQPPRQQGQPAAIVQCARARRAESASVGAKNHPPATGAQAFMDRTGQTQTTWTLQAGWLGPALLLLALAVVLAGQLVAVPAGSQPHHRPAEAARNGAASTCSRELLRSELRPAISDVRLLGRWRWAARLAGYRPRRRTCRCAIRRARFVSLESSGLRPDPLHRPGWHTRCCASTRAAAWCPPRSCRTRSAQPLLPARQRTAAGQHLHLRLRPHHRQRPGGAAAEAGAALRGAGVRLGGQAARHLRHQPARHQPDRAADSRRPPPTASGCACSTPAASG